MDSTDAHDILDPDTSIERVVTQGNLLRIETANDSRYWVAATEKNRLLYEKRVAELLAGGHRYVLSDDPYRAVATDDFTTFRVWSDDRDHPLYAPAEYAENVLTAVREHRDADSVSEFDSVVSLLTNAYARSHVVNAFAATELADAPVRVVADGWILHDLFLLTWDCDVFPYSGDDATPTRWDTEQDTEPSLYALTGIGEFVDDLTITVEGVEYTVNEREQTFLATARWLCAYEDAEEFYPAYWTNFTHAIDQNTA